MKKTARMSRSIKLVTLIIGSALMVGCAIKRTAPDFGSFQPANLEGYAQKVDDFAVLMDVSSSMNSRYKQGSSYTSTPDKATRFDVEREVLSRMNQTIPSTVQLTSGLRVFGSGDCSGWKESMLEFGVTGYTQEGFSQGLANAKCASGGTPMTSALEATGGDIASSQGNVAVILISDGNHPELNPAAAANALKKQYGSRLCLYTVWMGNDDHAGQEGKTLMRQLALTSMCGAYFTAEEIASSEGMGEFVKRVFLKKAICPDTDGDGVYGLQPGSSSVCLDECPNTPANVRVNSVGCWVPYVLFDFDKDTIKMEYTQDLDRSVEVLTKEQPNLRLEIQGWTDQVGSQSYNLPLSQRRAEAVKRYLVERGVAADRLTARGYGISRKFGSDAENRRVMFKPIQ